MHDSCYETDKGDICATEINLKTRTLKKYGYCEYSKKKMNLHFIYKNCFI